MIHLALISMVIVKPYEIEVYELYLWKMITKDHKVLVLVKQL